MPAVCRKNYPTIVLGWLCGKVRYSADVEPTLDDASWVKPAMQIYCDTPWVQLAGDMARFPKMPPSR